MVRPRSRCGNSEITKTRPYAGYIALYGGDPDRHKQ